MSKEMKDETSVVNSLGTSRLDGKKIKDKLGNTFVLREPTPVDNLLFMGAVGKDICENTMQLMYLYPLLYIAKHNDEVFPRLMTLLEAQFHLNRVGMAGLEAIRNAISDAQGTEEEVKQEIKK